MLLRLLFAISVGLPVASHAQDSTMAEDARRIEQASFDQFLADMPDRSRGLGDYFVDDPHANVMRIADCTLRTELLLNPAGQTPLVIGWGNMPIDASLEIEVEFAPWPALDAGSGPDLARVNIIHPQGTVSLYSLASGWSGSALFAGNPSAPLGPLDQLPLSTAATSSIAYPLLQDRQASSQRALLLAGLLTQYRDRYCTNFS